MNRKVVFVLFACLGVLSGVVAALPTPSGSQPIRPNASVPAMPSSSAAMLAKAMADRPFLPPPERR